MKCKRIVVIQGHPDQMNTHYCHAIAKAYMDGAISNNHTVNIIEAGSLSLPFLKNQSEFESDNIDPSISSLQTIILKSDHIVVIYPLWLGMMPAMLKHFFEQVFRPGFAFVKNGNQWPKKNLRGKSARVIVTMGMPSIIYHYFYRAHSLKSLEINILRFCGFFPIHHTIIGSVDSINDKKRVKWLCKIKNLGESGK